MKLFRAVFPISVLGLLLVACARLLPPASPLEPPIPTARLTAPMYTTQSATLALRNGYVLPMDCFRYSWGEEECRATFPNGNVMDYAANDFDWSPDNKFAIRRCVRSTHDSSCLDGDQVWDMINGVNLKHLTSGLSWSQWVPNEPHILAFVSNAIWNFNNVETLVFWDATTGAETRPTGCPDWIMRQTHRLVQVACAKLVGLPVPTITPPPLFNSSFSSSNNQLSFHVDCYVGECWLTVPSGKRIKNEIVAWSADYESATMCGGEQPKRCGVIQVWDTNNGNLIKTLPLGAFHRWSPLGHTLFYVQQAAPRLVAFDPKTNKETYPDKCPDWYRPDENLRWTWEVCQ